MSATVLTGKVQTVLGPIEPDDLGVTLTHEHLLIDLTCYYEHPDEASRRADVDAPLTIDMLGRMPTSWYYVLDNCRLYDVDVAIEEVSKYRFAGGNSVVDVSSVGLARDPLALARISRATGLNVVMGSSYYVPHAHPPDMDERTEDSIAEEIIRDVTVGVGETGIRSGIIGEVGNEYPMTDNERKILRASAHAQVETGAPISIHSGASDNSPLEIMEVLVEAGAEPTRVIMGHLDFAVHDRGALKSIAETGCLLEYDIFGVETSGLFYLNDEMKLQNDVQRIESVEFLTENGHLDQVVFAQDVCMKQHYTRYGGKGFAHIVENIVPRMRRRGFTDKQIDTVLVDNPKRILTFA